MIAKQRNRRWELLFVIYVIYFISVVAKAQINPGQNNSTCVAALEDMGNNVSSSHFLMRDATGKGLFGVFITGKVISDPGMWDQCLRIAGNVSNYCFLRSNIGKIGIDNTSFPLSIGACLPSVCSASDLEDAGWFNIKKSGIEIPTPMILGKLSVECYSNLNEINTDNLIAMIIIGFMFLLVMIATCIDLFIRSRLFESFVEKSKYDNVYMNLSYLEYATHDDEDDLLMKDAAPSHSSYTYVPKSKWLLSLRHGSTNNDEKASDDLVDLIEEDPFKTPQQHKLAILLMKIILCWSMVSNYKAIFQLPNTNAQKRFSFLHGLRVMSIVWLIFGYTCFYLPMMGWFNIEHLAETEEDFFYQLAVNSSLYAIDVFFLMSGLLSFYYAIEAMKEKPPKPDAYLKEYPQFVNVPFWIARRFVRLTPSLLIAVMFYWKIARYLGDGPFWNEYINRVTSECDQYWWASAFYLTSFYPAYILDLFTQVWGCVSWSWYLSCEVIFMILSPFVLFLFYKKKWLGVWISVLLLSCSVFIAFIIALTEKLSPGFGHQAETANFDDYGNLFYNKPYTRAAPYILGLLLAFIIQSFKTIHINAIIRVLVYVIVWPIVLFLLFISFTAYKYGWEEWANILFVSFSHPLFSFATAIFVLLMAYGYEGPLNIRRFFSSSLWLPYSRVTYGVYLYAPMIIEMTFASVQVNRAYSLYHVFFLFFSFVVISYIAGLVNYLVIEIPLLKAYDLLVPYKR